MALHTDLDIYKAAYELLGLVFDFVKNMRRDYKAPLGYKLRDECIELTTLICRANRARQKAPHIDSLIERTQVAEVLLRLSRDKELISTGQYARAIKLSTSVGKQAGGWRRQQLSPAS